MEEKIPMKLYISPEKAGIIITNSDPFLAKRIEVTTPMHRVIASYNYTPLLMVDDAKKLAKLSDYDETLCIELFIQINLYFSHRIGFFYAGYKDAFDLPKGMKFENIKKRVISQADLLLDSYKFNEIKENLWHFAARDLMDKDSDLAKEVESAAQMEFNRLVIETQKKREEDTTLTQQILILKHFDIIDFLDNKFKTDQEKAILLSYLLNKDKENIRHCLSALKVGAHIKNPSQYRMVVKKSKSNEKYWPFTNKNLDLLNKVLAELSQDKV